MVSAKISPQEMLAEISDKLIIYLKAGQVQLGSFLRKIDPNIQNFDQLVRIHFLLQEDVRNFIGSLPREIRNIRTSTQKTNRLYRGEVRGRINWQGTIAARYQTGHVDSTAYVCQQTDKDFNINENLVLKKLLSIINSIINTDLAGRPESYAWLSDWLGRTDLVGIFRQVYYRNIYVRKIDISEVKITPRMLESAQLSRNKIYRQAALLLKRYQEYTDQDNWQEDNQALRELFSSTFVKPENESVLFELYWIIKIIEANTKEADYLQLELVEGQENMVASWRKNGKVYKIYHDSAGSSRLKWQVELDSLGQVSSEFLKRQVASRRSAIEVSRIFKSSINQNIWSGRPDLIIEVFSDENGAGQLERLIIGEIKYSQNEETIKTGLKELMDYCYLVKEQHTGDYFTGDLTGLLLFDSLEIPRKSADGEDNSIRGISLGVRNHPILDEYCYRAEELLV